PERRWGDARLPRPGDARRLHDGPQQSDPRRLRLAVGGCHRDQQRRTDRRHRDLPGNGAGVPADARLTILRRESAEFFSPRKREMSESAKGTEKMTPRQAGHDRVPRLLSRFRSFRAFETRKPPRTRPAFDFDELAKELAGGLTRRETLR